MYGKVKEDLDDFKDAVNEKGAKGNSLAFKDSRYQEEINYEYTTVIDYFERRKRQVELVIDDHIIHLHGQKNYRKFENLSYEVKLKYILKKEVAIDQMTRMRMVDVTQSYNILDSVTHKDAKVVEEVLEENPEYDLVIKWSLQK